MYFSWTPVHVTKRADFFTTYNKIFLESLDPSNTEIETADISFYPGVQLIRARLSPQTVNRDAEVRPPDTILIQEPSVAFLLYRPSEIVIPILPNHSWLENANTLLGLMLNTNNVLQYVAYYFSIVFRNARYVIADMDDLSKNNLSDYQKGFIGGVLSPHALSKQGLLVFNIEANKYAFAGAVYSLTVPTIRDSKLALSKLHVSEFGFVTVDSESVRNMPPVEPPIKSEAYYCPEFSKISLRRHPLSASALANNWISMTTFVLIFVMYGRHSLNISASSQLPFLWDALFICSVISLLFYARNSALYQYRTFLGTRVPAAVTENWRGHDTMFFEWLGKRLGTWIAGSFFILAQMASLSFLWTFATFWLQERWSLLSPTAVPPTIDAAFSFSVVSLFTGLFAPLTDISPIFDQALIPPFLELTLWGKVVRTLIGLFFAATAAKAWSVLISKTQQN